MAERRMISKKVIFSDEFAKLPEKSRLAYFYLLLAADDEGFLGNTKLILTMQNLNQKSIVPLIEKGFFYYFDTCVGVIMHWYSQNRVAKDRFTPTIYREERNRLTIDENKTYVFR